MRERESTQEIIAELQQAGRSTFSILARHSRPSATTRSSAHLTTRSRLPAWRDV